MAYKSMTVASCATKAEFFCRLRDFLCARNGTYDYTADGIGWTLFDSSYAVDEDNPASGDWFVIYSPGENGDDDLYFKLEWTSNYIRTMGFLAWNPSTHAGTTAYAVSYNNSNFNVMDAAVSFPMWIDGDLDYVIIQYKYSTNTYTYAAVFGVFDPAPGCPGTRDVAVCSSALTAGSSVAITVDTVPDDWEVGMPIIIRTTHTNDISTAKMELTTIEAISGNVVTCTLVNSYTANSKLCSFWGLICSYGNQGLGSFAVIINSSGAIGATAGAIVSGMSPAYFDPSTYMDKYVLQSIFWPCTTGWPILYTEKIRQLGVITSPMAIGDYLVDDDGNVYRMIFSYSNAYYAIKEA